MVRHERTIEADKWELAVKVALATMAGETWEKASELAVSVRRELMASLDHITPSLDYTIAKAREQLKKGTQKDSRAKTVEAWTDESPMPTLPEKKK